jgi:GT2 family glycosyltransferase
MKKIAIGIPTINQFEYLSECLDRIYEVLPDMDIYIYNNSNINIVTKIRASDKVKIFGSGYNIGVAAAWNTMLTDMKANGYDYALILNDDIVLSKDIINIYEYVSNSNTKFSRIINDWSVFLISLDTFGEIGLFDENFFPAYFEDSDYNYRLKLACVEVDFPKILIPEIYRTSCSIRDNPVLNQNFSVNRQYYIAKWGGEPSYELFNKPFNNI